MLLITYDGQAPAWHPVNLNIPTGQWGIAMHAKYARFAEKNAGIDNVTITPGQCANAGTVLVSHLRSVCCSAHIKLFMWWLVL